MGSTSSCLIPAPIFLVFVIFYSEQHFVFVLNRSQQQERSPNILSGPDDGFGRSGVRGRRGGGECWTLAQIILHIEQHFFVYPPSQPATGASTAEGVW